MIHETAYIDPLAKTDDTVAIGEGSKVWQFASIIRGAKLGKFCNVASGACLDGSSAGDYTKIGHNLAAGPGFQIGNHVFIAPNVTLCNDAWPRAHVKGFDPSAYKDKPAIIIADHATVGSNAVILPGVHIGEGAMIAAGSVVTRNVPAWTLWKGWGEELMEIDNEDRKKRIRFARPEFHIA